MFEDLSKISDKRVRGSAKRLLVGGIALVVIALMMPLVVPHFERMTALRLALGGLGCFTASWGVGKLRKILEGRGGERHAN